MNQILVILMTLTTLSLTTLASQIESYSCDLAEGSLARHGAQKVSLSFASWVSSSRVTMTLYKFKRDGSLEVLGGAPAIYHHSSNVHVGQFNGFKKYTPSEKFQASPFFLEKFSEMVLRVSSDSKSAVLAFPESKQAIYKCIGH